VVVVCVLFVFVCVVFADAADAADVVDGAAPVPAPAGVEYLAVVDDHIGNDGNYLYDDDGGGGGSVYYLLSVDECF
jgi:hypothetical protein